MSFPIEAACCVAQGTTNSLSLQNEIASMSKFAGRDKYYQSLLHSLVVELMFSELTSRDSNHFATNKHSTMILQAPKYINA
jgi:hypothetical protein